MVCMFLGTSGFSSLGYYPSMELLGPQVTCLGLELDCQGLSTTVQQEQWSEANSSHQLTLRLKMVFGREDTRKEVASC